MTRSRNSSKKHQNRKWAVAIKPSWWIALIKAGEHRGKEQFVCDATRRKSIVDKMKVHNDALYVNVNVYTFARRSLFAHKRLGTTMRIYLATQSTRLASIYLYVSATVWYTAGTYATYIPNCFKRRLVLHFSFPNFQFYIKLIVNFHLDVGLKLNDGGC